MKMDFNQITKNFLLGEVKKNTDPRALLQAVKEILENIRPRSKSDQNRISVAQQHLREVNNSFKKLQERVNMLEEKLQVLEEMSSMGGGNVAIGSGPIGTKDKKDE